MEVLQCILVIVLTISSIMSMVGMVVYLMILILNLLYHKGDDIAMKREKIAPSSWKIIETIVIRYPERKQEYKTIVEQILDSSSCSDGQPKGNNIGNQVEGLVLKLNSPRILRMGVEIDAVGKAFDQMNSESKDLIEKRFWSEGGRRKTPYWCLCDAYMSERTMQRIIQSFFEIVGKEIGEL